MHCSVFFGNFREAGLCGWREDDTGNSELAGVQLQDGGRTSVGSKKGRQVSKRREEGGQPFSGSTGWIPQHREQMDSVEHILGGLTPFVLPTARDHSPLHFPGQGTET